MTMNRIKPVPWLWEPYLVSGMLNLLSGEPGSGKTYIALSVAASVTTGRIPLSGETCKPHDVLYLASDSSLERLILPRFAALEGNAKRFHVIGRTLSGSALESAILRTKARLLVIDPIQSFLGVSAHRSSEVRRILDALASLASKRKLCVLLLSHRSKSASGKGSITLAGAARSELCATRQGGERLMVHVKSNVGKLGASIGYEIRNDIFIWTKIREVEVA